MHDYMIKAKSNQHYFLDYPVSTVVVYNKHSFYLLYVVNNMEFYTVALLFR